MAGFRLSTLWSTVPAVGTTATERNVVTFGRVRTFVADAGQSLPPARLAARCDDERSHAAFAPPAARMQ
jgi:hypothetical protein